MTDATHAFNVLRGVLQRLHGDGAAARDQVDMDALYIWSTVQGVAGVMNGECVHRMDLKARVVERAVQHVMERMSIGVMGAAALAHAGASASHARGDTPKR